MILEEVGLVADVAKELKNDLKGDVRRIETIVEDVETRVKEDSRSNEKDLKLTVDGIESDMEKLENELNEAMTELQENIDKQIKMTLANPLSQMK
jgi:BMFP domain-containing protein YqiC